MLLGRLKLGLKVHKDGLRQGLDLLDLLLLVVLILVVLILVVLLCIVLLFIKTC